MMTMSDFSSIKQKALDKLEEQLTNSDPGTAREAAREILGYDIALRHAQNYHSPFIGEVHMGDSSIGQDAKDPDGIQGS
jgi:hypothetical protein